MVCPSIPGCYSQGHTVNEALANIQEAIELYLEEMEGNGMGPKLPVLLEDEIVRNSSMETDLH